MKIKCVDCKMYKKHYNPETDYKLCRGTNPSTTVHICKSYLPKEGDSYANTK